MRSRTEQITTTLEGSDFEDDASDVDDSEEDWHPQKKNAKGKLTTNSPKKTGNKKRSSTSKKTQSGKGRGAAKKKKREEESSDEEESEDEGDEEEEEDYDSEEDGSDEEKNEQSEDAGSEQQTVQKKIGKDGIFELLINKFDLKSGIETKKDLSLWKRDGTSLLQRYTRKNTSKPNDIIFAPTSSYSCWEVKRKEDFFDIKVRCIDNKSGDVRIADEKELENLIEEAKKCSDQRESSNDEAANEEDDAEEGDED